MPTKFGIYGDIVLFGIRIIIESDDPEGLDMLRTAFARWRDAEPADDEDPIYAVIDSTMPVPADETCSRVTNGCLLIAGDGIRIEADGGARRGRCMGARLRDPQALRDAAETMLLFLVAQAGRTPLHASAILIGGCAMVLAGRSGAGKSTLALAADRAGLPVLSDDTVFVQTAPRLRLWSFGDAIHVFEKDAPDGMAAPMRFRSGRWKRKLPVAPRPHHAGRSVLCLLRKGDAVALAPVEREAAVRDITAAPEPGYDFYGGRLAEAARAVAREGAWSLTLSSDPRAAIALLMRTFSVPAAAGA